MCLRNQSQTPGEEDREMDNEYVRNAMDDVRSSHPINYSREEKGASRRELYHFICRSRRERNVDQMKASRQQGR